MSQINAGFGRVEITPDKMGYPLLGYGNRQGGSSGVHDSLWAKALVIQDRQNPELAWAICSLDLCWVNADMVAQIRTQVSQKTDLVPEAILIAATHTHSGPDNHDAGNWQRPFSDLVAEAIIQAWAQRQPAQIAHGAGFLYGHSLNRRWFERPVDPAVGVLKVSSPSGELLGTVTNFGCHPVVMGADNLLISADYVGYACAMVEAELGGVCIFTNGGCADINPLTDTVRRQLAEKRAFTTMVPEVHYYGQPDDPISPISIGNRRGGKFSEAETLGRALGSEICYIAQRLSPGDPGTAPWYAQAWVNHLDEAQDPAEELIETQALGLADFALIAQPGEIFVETALDLKAKLRAMGYHFPWAVSYANDWQLYLTPASAYPEEGYEVKMAQSRNHSPQIQTRLWTGIYEKF